MVAALLYYVGWLYTTSKYAYFGIDPSMLGLSVDGALIYSASTMIPVLSVYLALAVGLIQAHRRLVVPRLSRLTAGARSRLAVFLWIFAAVAGAFAFLRFNEVLTIPTALDPGLPVIVAAAAGTAIYAHAFAPPRPEGAGDRRADLVSALLAVLTVVALVWALSLYASSRGKRSAEYLGTHLTDQPEVTIYSPGFLVLPGVAVTAAGANLTPQQLRQLEAETSFRYRYSGLRLLTRTPDGYLLVRDDWTPGQPVYLVDRDGIRFDFSHQP